MENIALLAIQQAQHFEIVYTKFISSNDVGKTAHQNSRSHQAGFYISRSFVPFIFEQEIQRNIDYEAFVTIKWQNEFETESRFKYYGSKNECHLTRLGRDFPFRNDDNIGDLLIICKERKEFYHAFVLQSDSDIEDFFAALNISALETNRIIPKHFEKDPESLLRQCFEKFINSLQVSFPTTYDLATNARACFNNVYKISKSRIKSNPDGTILDWLQAEFLLFKTIENNRYSERIKTPFATVEELVETANTILNRRKSRAGRSLEHHLEEVFSNFELFYSTQAITEDNKKPDFLFPNLEAYHNPNFDNRKLTVLASKTTCKDRWRQILNEADRIKTKHLFTLQQGISKNQLEEMYKYDVCLVVPKPYLKSFPEEFRPKILPLDNFISNLLIKQA